MRLKLEGTPLPQKIGEPEVLAKGYGKAFLKQWYTNPRTGKPDDFTLFHANTVPTIFMAVTERGEVIAIEQYRHGVARVMVEFPGGNPKPGQTPLDVIKAELEEETGYAPGTMIRLTERTIPMEPASMTTEMWPYLVLGCQKVGEPKPDPTEFITVRLFGFREFEETLVSGLVDSKIIAIWHLALPHLKNLGVSLRLP